MSTYGGGFMVSKATFNKLGQNWYQLTNKTDETTMTKKRDNWDMRVIYLQDNININFTIVDTQHLGYRYLMLQILNDMN
jgi:hypothetical protein